MPPKTVTDALRLALGKMTEDAHKELQDAGYKPTDDKRENYVTPDGMELPANKAYKTLSSESKKKGNTYPTPN